MVKGKLFKYLKPDSMGILYKKLGDINEFLIFVATNKDAFSEDQLEKIETSSLDDIK